MPNFTVLVTFVKLIFRMGAYSRGAYSRVALMNSVLNLSSDYLAYIGQNVKIFTLCRENVSTNMAGKPKQKLSYRKS